MKVSDISGRTKLVNGIAMPYLGLGVYKMNSGNEVKNAVHHALDVGYRLIDTASFYNNETGVGQAIKDSKINREEVFVTSKLWIEDQGKENTRRAFQKSLDKLGFEYLDLYLIHWPVPKLFLESWKVLQELYSEDKVKVIGVSNCMKHHLEEIKSLGGVQPMVLQNEFHPKLIQQSIVDYCKKHNIQYQAWSPLMRGRILENDLIQNLAKKYKKSAAQIVLRWDLEKGIATIPKSVHKARIIENSRVFDFQLNTEEINLINNLEDGTRTGAHPDNFMSHFQQN